LLCAAGAKEEGLQATDAAEDVLTARKILHEGEELGCHCEGHEAHECPCHPDITWLKNGECPSCPVYGCGDCDPLKCDECKRCCEGNVLSDDRLTCSCPTCDIPKCLECDAMNCDLCLVCAQGYELDEERKCKCSTCHVPDCQTCSVENCYVCETCEPFLTMSYDQKTCECPECAIAGCKKCSTKNCKDCEVCAGNAELSYDKKSCTDTCTPEKCAAAVAHCTKCDATCKTCLECAYGYEVIMRGYETFCKCAECEVDYCEECDPENCDECLKCKEGYSLSLYKGGYKKGPAECVCDPCDVKHCATCDPADCSKCAECYPGFIKHDDGSCKCEKCKVPGCTTCDPDDCTKCKECAKTHVLQDDGTCACATCDVPYCATCDVTDCSVCTCCMDGYTQEGYGGECVCATCDIPHCKKCSNDDCTICEVCEPYYGPSGTNDCPCESCEVDNCQVCDPEDCDTCKTCNEGLVPSDDATTCECAECKIENCKTCDPNDCNMCLECEEGLVATHYGAKCECDGCDVVGCDKCDAEDCTKCDTCKPGLTPNDDATECVCSDCPVPCCEECDINYCDTKCKVCKDPKIPNAEGACECPDPEIPYCSSYNKDECGLCDECQFFYELSADKKSCSCDCDRIIGCKECDDTCSCTECDAELTKSDCGYCLIGQPYPGCDYNLLLSLHGADCGKVCGYSSRFSVAVQVGTYNGKPRYPCYVDLGKEGALRPGTLNWTGSDECMVEYNSHGKPGASGHTRFIPKKSQSTSFLCVCETEDLPMAWYPREWNEDYEVEQPDGNCTAVCENKGMYSVSLPGFHNGKRLPGEPKYIPYSVCRAQGKKEYEGGYNVHENGLSQWSGWCLTPEDAYDEYDCLCASECVHPDCSRGYTHADPIAYEEEHLWTT